MYTKRDYTQVHTCTSACIYKDIGIQKDVMHTYKRIRVRVYTRIQVCKKMLYTRTNVYECVCIHRYTFVEQFDKQSQLTYHACIQRYTYVHSYVSCVYTKIYVCTLIRIMRIYTDIRMYTHISERAHAHAHTTHVYNYHTCICVNECIHTHTSVQMHTNMYTYVRFIYTHIHA